MVSGEPRTAAGEHPRRRRGRDEGHEVGNDKDCGDEDKYRDSYGENSIAPARIAVLMDVAMVEPVELAASEHGRSGQASNAFLTRRQKIEG